MVALEDAPLVARLRAQERGAFDELYARHHGRIFGFLLRLSGRRDEAEDLFQETWVKAARHAHRLEEGSRLLPWLFTIARNEYRSARRFLVFDFRKRKSLELELDGRTAESPEELSLEREEVVLLERALFRLDAAHREVLLLAHVEGLPSADIAAVLGQSDDVVRKRLSRARALLREGVAALTKTAPPPARAPAEALAEDDEARDPS